MAVTFQSMWRPSVREFPGTGRLAVRARDQRRCRTAIASLAYRVARGEPLQLFERLDHWPAGRKQARDSARWQKNRPVILHGGLHAGRIAGGITGR
jgi:hypothetical protein